MAIEVDALKWPRLIITVHEYIRTQHIQSQYLMHSNNAFVYNIETLLRVAKTATAVDGYDGGLGAKQRTPSFHI